MKIIKNMLLCNTDTKKHKIFGGELLFFSSVIIIQCSIISFIPPKNLFHHNPSLAGAKAAASWNYANLCSFSETEPEVIG